jgi:hypothetical protein
MGILISMLSTNEENGRMKPSSYYNRIVDVMEDWCASPCCYVLTRYNWLIAILSGMNRAFQSIQRPIFWGISASAG